MIPGSGRSTGEGIGYPLQYSWASLEAQLVKNSCLMWETWVQSLVWEVPWGRERLPTPVSWPGEFHGLYRLWGSKDWDATFTFTVSDILCIKECFHFSTNRKKFLLWLIVLTQNE